MSFLEKATVEGCPQFYKINPKARAYTFKDYGFQATPSGNLQLVRPLDISPQAKQSPKLKITVAKDLKTLKMSLTTANGLKTINIFKSDDQKDKQEQFYYIMEDLMSFDCLEKA
ncbi:MULTISPECIES: cysteine desulfurase [Enterococcaceae]|uniref:cysteine desulfurase n=1 Tax=Enterococcaceae TaxID=81852 RepID=UPI000E54026C|nr:MULTISPECIES: cysteine desulfurase [Enterococcaceae]RGI30812.1 cysteine desulfurase [Melissococcus sp. OM08-11BH]UNM88789.1 DUF1831 domain-containing protein [Vagococcus sp. CY52-2]